MPWAPVPLTPDYSINQFSSGVASLDEWLVRRALANRKSGASRTFVSCEGNTVVAYYALASSAIAAKTVSGKFRRNMPDPIPVVVLARLAVAQSHHGTGLGRGLFLDAARRVLGAADTIGIRGLIVHAISEEARSFYLHLGLDPSPLERMTLMVTLADLRQSVEL